MRRHSLAMRLWHWGNLACLVVLFMSGLTISNAHRRLYWGDWGFAEGQEWLAVPRFPDWMTIPGYYNLALARDWHILVAWPFALLLLFAWTTMLATGHFRRDIATTRGEWRPDSIRADIAAHLRLDFTHGGQARGYNFLQKLAYGIVLGVLLPGMVFTGMAISPGMGTSLGWLVDLLGGRQTARSLHFIFAFALLGFLIIHVLLVLVSGPARQMRAMITGADRHAA